MGGLLIYFSKTVFERKEFIPLSSETEYVFAENLAAYTKTYM